MNTSKPLAQQFSGLFKRGILDLELPRRRLNLQDSETYDLWVSSKPAFTGLRDHYVRLGLAAAGPVAVLEAGGALVGRRVSSARKGGTFIAPLAARGAALADFSLPLPVSLLALPLGGIEGLWKRERRERLFRNACKSLAPEGRFVFDEGTLCPVEALVPEGVPRLAAEKDEAAGLRMLWETWRSEQGGRRLECRLGVELLSRDGTVEAKTYGSMLFAPVTEEEVRGLALDAGLEVEGFCVGFGASVRPRLWVLRRAACSGGGPP